jgi:hypothetical protein
VTKPVIPEQDIFIINKKIATLYVHKKKVPVRFCPDHLTLFLMGHCSQPKSGAYTAPKACLSAQ